MSSLLFARYKPVPFIMPKSFSTDLLQPLKQCWRTHVTQKSQTGNPLTTTRRGDATPVIFFSACITWTCNLWNPQKWQLEVDSAMKGTGSKKK